MALTIKNYELPDGSILEEAYIRVQTVQTTNADYEYLEPIPDSEDLITKWLTRIESQATVYVYADKPARDNRVSPLFWFQIPIHYNLSEWTNVFEQAYSKLRELYPTAEDC